jgi:uncharacterized protein YukE
MQGHFRVDPSELLMAADELERLAGRIESEGYGVRQSGANLSVAVGNRLASGAVDGLTAAWGSALQELVAALHRDAASLRSVAERYRRADEAVAQDLQQVMAGLSP